MKDILTISIMLATTLLMGCQSGYVPKPEELQSFTTPALERIPELRKRESSKVEWEDNLRERIEVISSAKRLRTIISEWNLTDDELNNWAKEYNRASEVIYYGTDMDGRMIIFYDSHGLSIASWASWDRSERDQEAEQDAT